MSGLHPDSYQGQRVFHTAAARTIHVEPHHCAKKNAM